jgi:hypothetical protein
MFQLYPFIFSIFVVFCIVLYAVFQTINYKKKVVYIVDKNGVIQDHIIKDY